MNAGLGNSPVWPRWRYNALGVAALACAAAANEFVVARFFSGDGVLDPATVTSLRLLQVALAAAGFGLLLRRRMILLPLIVSLGGVNIVLFRERVNTTPADSLTSKQARLRQLRSALPDAGYVGYISDESPWKSSKALEQYYLTQYALAPLIIEIGADRDLVIGNFKKYDPQLTPDGMVMVQDFGNGLVLFRRNSC